MELIYPLSKFEINSKLDEINNRLKKIGRSITPVKTLISNYMTEEKKINNFNNYNFKKINLKYKYMSKIFLKKMMNIQIAIILVIIF